MIQTFITAFKLKNTYRVNSIIYAMKGLPIINKILPDSLYKNKTLKIVGNIISTLIEIGNTFLGKLLYLLLMVFLMTFVYETDSTSTYLHIFTFLTMAGGLLNTYIFNPTKDKYYAISIMNMDANKFALSNYYYSIIKIILGFIPFTILFGVMAKVPLWICMLMPIFVVMIKMIVINCNLYYFKKTGIANNENLPVKTLWVLVFILMGISYGLPFIGITIKVATFLAIFLTSTIIGSISFLKIIKFKNYKKMYKQLLTPNNVYMVQNQTSAQMVKENTEKQIEYDANFTSNKNGFAYFHDLFVKRHSKILTKAVKKQTIAILMIFAILLIAIVFNSEISKKINTITLMYLPYFIFVMYLLNRGTILTQAMFMNCDHSMLTYRIYRTPKVLLGIFKERLKTLITINLLPAFIIGVGLSTLLYLTGGTDNPLNYVVLFLSIIAMSIFFSVHYLVMYYLLQPYNISTELKNSTYQVIQTVTYIVCYMMIQIKLPTISFGIVAILFSVLYCFLSLVLVYKLAPKTFKIRI